MDDLDTEQRAAAQAVTGPVCIIAGAGTGKTRTVTYRLAYGILTNEVEASRALAITHSKKAAAELAERLHRLGAGGVDARTFHAAGLRVAGQFWARTGRPGRRPSVLAEREAWRLWRDCVRAFTGTEPDNVTVRDLVDEVDWARSRLVDPQDYETAAVLADRNPGINPPTVLGCWGRYTEAKRRLERVDFADLLEIAAWLLTNDVDVAQAVRHRWAHVTVDEYQDTDPAQQRLLDAIVGGGQELCVVGDPRQSIYSWKGADPTYLTRFTKRYPPARVFDLTRNYRSSPQILAWANSLARERGTKPLTATRPAGPVPQAHRLDTEADEAGWIAGTIRKAMAAGTPPSEIAVLYRFNSAQARFEAALTQADIAIVVADDVPFFERDEISSVLVAFDQAAQAQPQRKGLELLTETLARSGFNPQSPPPGLGAARTRWESQQALLYLVGGLPDADQRDAKGTLAEIKALGRRTADRPTGGVTLATLHRAKGLEWTVVFVAGVTDGAIPSTYATTPSERAEEERLLHVGVTRARNELHLTWAAVNARGWANRPSPFLDQLPTGRPTLRGPADRPRTRSKANVFPPDSGSCAHCAAPLKGLAPRRLGICADCVRSAPGDLGRRAREVLDLAAAAAQETGDDPEKLITRSGLLRLLDKRPDSASHVSATIGVQVTSEWAAKIAEALKK
jgi:DNA helicase-2/ATP-dependent DNA helicase PcrA